MRKNLFKRFLASLGLLAITSVIPVSSIAGIAAARFTDSPDIIYYLDNETFQASVYRIQIADTSMDVADYPTTITIKEPFQTTKTGYEGTYTVTSILPGAFKLEDSEKGEYATLTLGYNREHLLMNMQEINIASTVTTIGRKAFSGCGIPSITIPESVTSIGDSILSDCPNLQTAVVKASYTDTYGIPSNMFEGCTKLQSVTFEQNVFGIGAGAFKNCTSLSDITFKGDVNNFTALASDAFEGVDMSEVTIHVPHGSVANFNKIAALGATVEELPMPTNFTVGDITYTVTSADNMQVYVATNQNQRLTTPVVIPATVSKDGYTFSVVGIAASAFDHCLYIPSITLPEGIQVIEASAFTWCSALTSLTIPSTVTTLGSVNDFGIFCATLFDNSGITSITIPESVTTIGAGALYTMPNLTEATINAHISEIPTMMFSGSENLQTLHLNSPITSIGTNAFSGVTLENLTITVPDGATLSDYQVLADLGVAAITTESGNQLYPEAAAAVKHFVQVKSVRQLQDSGEYVVGAVNANSSAAANFPRFYDMKADGTKAIQTANNSTTEFPNSMIWTLQRITGVSCNSTADGHNNHSHVFAMTQDGKAIINHGNSHELSLSTANPLPTTTYIEFVQTSSTHFADETLFSVHFNWDNNNQKLQATRAMGVRNNDPQFNTFTDNSNTIQKFDSDANYSNVCRVYLVVDEAHPEIAAQVYWNAKIEEFTDWANSINPDFAEALRAMPLPTNINWDITITDAGDLEALTSQINDAFPAAFDAAVLNYLSTSGNQYAFKNANTGKYATKDGTQYFNGQNEITVDGTWDIVNNDGAMSFKLHGQEIYAGAMPSNTNAPNISQVTSLEQAGKYHFELVQADSLRVFVKRHTDGPTVAQQWHCNTANLQMGTGTGKFSQWIIEEIGVRVELLKAEAEIAPLRTRVAALGTHGINGLYTADEISALKSVVDGVSYEYDSTMSDSEIHELIATSKATVETAVNNFIAEIEAKPAFIKFTRSNQYVRINGTTFEAVPQVGASSTWIFQHQGNLAFKLYNPAAEKYMSGHAGNPSFAAEDNGHLIWHLAPCTKNNATYQYHAILVNEDRSGNAVLHQSTLGQNVEGFPTGTIWYTQGDEGSAIEIYYTAEDLIEKMQTESAAVATLSTYADKVSATHELGKFQTTGYDAAQAVFDGLTAESVSAENILTSFEAINAAVADESTIINANLLYMPKSGDYIRARASVSNPANGQVTLHYTTHKYNSTDGNWMYAGTDEATDENSIFLFEDGKLLSYSTGFYAAEDSNPRLIYNTDYTANNGAAVKFVNGHNEIDAYQIILGTSTNLHIYQPSHAKGLHIDRCGSTGTKDELHHNWNLELIHSLPVTIGASGYGSIVAPVALELQVVDNYQFYTFEYVVEGLNKNFQFREVEEFPATIEANTPILVAGPVNTTVNLGINYDYVGAASVRAREAEATADEPQLIVAHASHIAKAHAVDPEATEEFNTYALSSEELNGYQAGDVVFTPIAEGDELAAGTMHLTMPAKINEYMGGEEIVKDGKAVLNLNSQYTTGIREILSGNAEGDDVIYDLQGRRLNAPIHGINIINGRKVLVK